MGRVHFIGIGGVGMNGLAQLAARAFASVSGSDRGFTPDQEPFTSLMARGISLVPQDGSGISPNTECVVYSTAIESDNPDLQQAKKLGVRTLHRAEFLKELIGNAPLIAIAGTAGKSTTTGLLGWIFECLAHDPTVYNGAPLLNWKCPGNPGSVRHGESGPWIIEADESDRSFLHFKPTHTIITNISRDHYELNELQQMFARFRAQTEGIAIEPPHEVVAGSKPNSFLFEDVEFEIPMVGAHNLENALCAVKLCHALNMDLKRVCEAIALFGGIERRLQRIGTFNNVTVIDDYAHNPAKIAAALAATADLAQSVHAYWRPHGFSPLAQNFDGLVEVLTAHLKKHSGSLHILPVYYAGGTVQADVTSNHLVTALQNNGAQASLAPDYASLRQTLHHMARPGDAILGMGARDPELPHFARRLVETWNKETI